MRQMLSKRLRYHLQPQARTRTSRANKRNQGEGGREAKREQGREQKKTKGKESKGRSKAQEGRQRSVSARVCESALKGVQKNLGDSYRLKEKNQRLVDM